MRRILMATLSLIALTSFVQPSYGVPVSDPSAVASNNSGGGKTAQSTDAAKAKTEELKQKCADIGLDAPAKSESGVSAQTEKYNKAKLEASKNGRDMKAFEALEELCRASMGVPIRPLAGGNPSEQQAYDLGQAYAKAGGNVDKLTAVEKEQFYKIMGARGEGTKTLIEKFDQGQKEFANGQKSTSVTTNPVAEGTKDRVSKDIKLPAADPNAKPTNPMAKLGEKKADPAKNTADANTPGAPTPDTSGTPAGPSGTPADTSNQPGNQPFNPQDMMPGPQNGQQNGNNGQNPNQQQTCPNGTTLALVNGQQSCVSNNQNQTCPSGTTLATVNGQQSCVSTDNINNRNCLSLNGKQYCTNTSGSGTDCVELNGQRYCEASGTSNTSCLKVGGKEYCQNSGGSECVDVDGKKFCSSSSCSGGTNLSTAQRNEAGFKDGARLAGGVCGIGVDPCFTNDTDYLNGYYNGQQECRRGNGISSTTPTGKDTSDRRVREVCGDNLQAVADSISVPLRLVEFLFRPQSSLSSEEANEFGTDETRFNKLYRAKVAFEAGKSDGLAKRTRNSNRAGNVPYTEGYDCSEKL